MKKENDIDNIIGKVTEMRDFFKFGGEIIPFLIESAPNEGPTIFSYFTSISAGKAPELSIRTKSLTCSREYPPEIVPE